LVPIAGLLSAAGAPLSAPAAQQTAERRSDSAAEGSAWDDYQLVLSLCERGQLELARGEALAFLERHARHERAPHVRYRLAGLLFDARERAAALGHYAALARLAGFDFAPECALREGQCLLGLQRNEEARAAFERALGAATGERAYLAPAARYYLGELELAAGNVAPARAHYEWILARPNEDEAARALRSEAEEGLAWCALRAGNAEQALVHVQRAAQRPANGTAADASAAAERAGELAYLEAEALRTLGRADEAAAAYARATSGPRAESALLHGGYARLDAGDARGAAERFGALLERFPQSTLAAHACVQHAAALLQVGDASGALAALEHPAAAADATTRLWRARALARLERETEALAELERAAAQSKFASPALAAELAHERARLLLEAGRGAEVLAASAQAGPRELLALAARAFERGDAPLAASLCAAIGARGTSALAPEEARAAASLEAEALLASSTPAAARAACERALELASDATERAAARARLAWCAHAQGELELAAQLSRELLRETPQAPEAQTARGLLVRVLHARSLAARARGALEEAQAAQRELLELAPDAPEAAHARFELALADERAGRRAEAATALESLARDERGTPELRASAREWLVWVHARAGELERAELALDRFGAAGGAPERVLEAARALAEACAEREQLARAQSALERALPHLPSREHALEALLEAGRYALRADAHERALDYARVALGLEPTSESACALAEAAGDALREAGASAPACAAYELASSARAPRALHALHKLAWAQRANAQDAAARASLDTLLTRDPPAELARDAALLAGELAFAAGESERALALLEPLREAPLTSDQLAQLQLRLGLAYSQLGRWRECARELGAYCAARANAPERAECELLRGRALRQLGEARAARTALEQALELGRGGALAARARLELAELECAQAQGPSEAALGQWLRVAALHAGSEEAGEALWRAGECLEALGRAGQARAQYAELVASLPQHARATAARTRLAALGG